MRVLFLCYFSELFLSSLVALPFHAQFRIILLISTNPARIFDWHCVESVNQRTNDILILSHEHGMSIYLDWL